MQAYETGLKSSDTRLVLSPNSDFFRYFNRPTGTPAPGAASPAPPTQAAAPAAGQ
jgi:membrane protease subunit HflC